MKGASQLNVLKRGRLAHVDGLRAFCALFVVLHHSWLTPFPAELHIFPKGNMGALTNWLVYGRGAVACFIVISGFCLSLPFIGKNNVRPVKVGVFYWRRIRRIVPPTYAGAGLTVLLTFAFISDKIATHWSPAIPLTWQTMFANVFLVQNIYQGPTINHAYWSIGLESQIYVLFPLLIWLGRKVTYSALAIVLLPLGCLVQMWLEPAHLGTICPHFLGLFVAGIVAADIYSRGVPPKLSTTLSWLAAGMAMSTLFWLAFQTTQTIWNNLVLLDVVTGSVMFCLLAAGARSESWTTRLFSWAPLVWVGEISFSLYLIHAPLVEILWRYAVVPMNLPVNAAFAVLSVLAIVVCVALARAFFEVFERRFITQNRERAISVSGEPAMDGTGEVFSTSL